MKSLLTSTDESNLNAAIGHELYAAHLYRHLANQLQRLGYFGAQKFFAAESSDELEHYQKLVDYMNDMGTVAKSPAVDAMNESVGSLQDALQIAFDTEHELLNLYAKWHGQADVVTAQFLLQFIEIQRKSVGEYGDLLARLERCREEEGEFDPCGILLIDQEMGGK